MEPSHQPFENWLTNHLDLVPYIKVSKFFSGDDRQSFDIERNQKHSEIVNSISSSVISYFKYDALRSKLIKKTDDLRGKGDFSFRQTNYLLSLIHQKGNAITEKFSKISADLFTLFRPETTITKDIILTFDSDLFLHDFHQLPSEIIRLSSGISYYSSISHSHYKKYNTFESQRDGLKQIIEGAITIYEENLNYIQPNPLQDIYEDILLSDYFPLKSPFLSLIDFYNDSESIEWIISLIRTLMKSYNITKSFSASIFFIFSLRFVFDRIFIKQINFLVENPKLTKLFNDLTFEQFNPPNIFSKLDKSTNIGEFFRSNQNYLKAINHLQNIIFYSSPIDILFCVHECLNEINQIISSEENIEGLISFEDAFTHFMCILIAANVPSIDQISDFIESTTKNVNLNPHFDYAKNKLIASIKISRELLEDN